MKLTQADRDLAAMFAGPLEGELTEAQLLGGDAINARAKADGSLQQRRINAAQSVELQRQAINGVTW